MENGKVNLDDDDDDDDNDERAMAADKNYIFINYVIYEFLFVQTS